MCLSLFVMVCHFVCHLFCPLFELALEGVDEADAEAGRLMIPGFGTAKKNKSLKMTPRMGNASNMTVQHI